MLESLDSSDCALNVCPEENEMLPSSFFPHGQIHVILSSHQDVGWEDTPEQCAQKRDTDMLAPALELLRQNPEFRYSVECTLSLMEYLERHPDQANEIREMTRRGRLEWGATYNMPYESLMPGEALIRQTYLGKKWLKKKLPGCDTSVAWNPDVPARAMQMPQILAKSGIPYLVMSRHQKGIYRWKSPDGSSVLAFSPGHYYSACLSIFDEDDEGQLKYRRIHDIVTNINRLLHDHEDAYHKGSIAPHVPLLISRDLMHPVKLDALIEPWNQITVEQGGLPHMKCSTAHEFFAQLDKCESEFKPLDGKRPNIWLYIHGPAHHKAISAGRMATRLLTAAEKLATVEAVLSGDFNSYPLEVLTSAWADAIYPDHGWGGNNGHMTDRIFHNKYESALRTADRVLKHAMESISKRACTSSRGIPIVVFNALSWRRSDPVECDIDVTSLAYPHKDRDLSFELEDSNENRIPHQVVPSRQIENGPGEHLRIVFVAEEVPSIGFKTYYLVSKKQMAEPPSCRPPVEGQLDNRFYRVKLGPGGIDSIYDKELQHEILRPGKFLGFELFSMHSEGTGAGEFTEVQQPTMKGFEQASRYGGNWNQIENGPVRAVWELVQRMAHCSLRLRMILYHNVKRIDCEFSILGWEGRKFREFRLALPLNMDEYNVAYEVPLGVVDVGKSEIEVVPGKSYYDYEYSQPCSEIRPREVQDWFHANDGEIGVTVSSSVAVFDWVDPTDDPVSYPVLQPVLLASRHSVNPRGNWFLQPGDHSYRFSLFSHQGDWRRAYREGTQGNQPLFAVTADGNGTNGTLPDELSFCSVSPGNVVISTMKKGEDEDAVIVRCYDIEGEDSHAEVEVFFDIREAARCNLIEEEDAPIAHSKRNLSIDISHHAIETLKLVPFH